MRAFKLQRHEDVTGVSGTGEVAQGVEFDDGTTVLRWTVPDAPHSTVVWDTLAEAMAVHGHDGKTSVVIVWSDQDTEDKEVSTVIYRDAKTGKIVTEDYASHHPATTTREIV